MLAENVSLTNADIIYITVNKMEALCQQKAIYLI